MKINPISFMGEDKYTDLSEVKALKKLDLDGTYVPSSNSAIRNFNTHGGKLERDEFILSQMPGASKLAGKIAGKDSKVSYDDAFQKIMLAIVEYANDRCNNGDNVYASSAHRVMLRAAQQDVPEDVFIEDVEPIDERDMVDVIGAKNASEDIEEILGTLPPRQEHVLRKKFGFDGNPETYSRMAEEYGVNKSYIREIYLKGERMIKHPIRLRKLYGVQDSIGKAEPIFSTTKD